MKRTELSSLRSAAVRVLQNRNPSGLASFVARNVSMTFVMHLLGSGVLFGATALAARLAGDVNFGYYAYATAWVHILLLGCEFGGPDLRLRYVAQYEARSQYPLLRGVLQHTQLISMTVSVGIGLLICAMIWLLPDGRVNPALGATLLVAALLLPIRALGSLSLATLQAFRRVLLSNWAGIARPSAFGVVLLLLAWRWDRDLTGPQVMGAQLVASVLGLLLAVYFISRCLPTAVRQQPAEFQRMEWVGVAKSLWFISGSQLIRRQTDIIMIGLMIGASEAGIYTAVTRTATLVLVGMQITGVVIAPLISSLHASGQHERLQRMLDGVTLLVTGLMLMVSVPLLLFPEFVLSLFGAEFARGSTALQITLIGQIVKATSGPVGMAMIMTGHEKPASFAIGTTAGLNVVLNLALIPPFGMAGAAVATAVSTTIYNGCLATYAWRHLGLRTAIWLPRPG